MAFSKKAGFCSTRSTSVNSGSSNLLETRPIPAPQSERRGEGRREEGRGREGRGREGREEEGREGERRGGERRVGEERGGEGRRTKELQCNEY